MKTRLLAASRHVRRHRMWYAVAVLALCGTLAAAKIGARVEFIFRINRGLECSDAECRNEWGECFVPAPDAHGVVNLDEMRQVYCPPETQSPDEGDAAPPGGR